MRIKRVLISFMTLQGHSDSSLTQRTGPINLGRRTLAYQGIRADHLCGGKGVKLTYHATIAIETRGDVAPPTLR